MLRQIRAHTDPIPDDWWEREDNWEDLDDNNWWAFVEGGITTIYCQVLAIVQIREKPEEV